MSKFTDAIDDNLEGLEHVSAGLCAACEECRNAQGFEDEDVFDKAISCGEVSESGGFSHSFCDSCGTAYHPRYERERGRIVR